MTVPEFFAKWRKVELKERSAAQEHFLDLCRTGGGGKMEEMLHADDLLTAAGLSRYGEARERVFKADAVLDEKECPFTGFAPANALGPVGRRTCHQGHCMSVDNRRIVRAQVPGTIVVEHMQDPMIHTLLHF